MYFLHSTAKHPGLVSVTLWTLLRSSCSDFSCQADCIPLFLITLQQCRMHVVKQGNQIGSNFYSTYSQCTYQSFTPLYCATLHFLTQLYISLLRLHCTALHCTKKYYTTLQCTANHCTALNETAQYCLAPYITTLFRTKLHSTEPHWTVRHCTALNFTALHSTAGLCNTKHWNTLQSADILSKTTNTIKHFAALQISDCICPAYSFRFSSTHWCILPP